MHTISKIIFITLILFSSFSINAENLVVFRTGTCIQVNGDPNTQYTLVSATCVNSPQQNWRINALNINSQYTISYLNNTGIAFTLQVSPQGALILSRNTTTNIYLLYWNGALWLTPPGGTGYAYRRWENIGASHQCLRLNGNNNLVVAQCDENIDLIAIRPSSEFIVTKQPKEPKEPRDICTRKPTLPQCKP